MWGYSSIILVLKIRTYLNAIVLLGKNFSITSTFHLLMHSSLGRIQKILGKYRNLHLAEPNLIGTQHMYVHMPAHMHTHANICTYQSSTSYFSSPCVSRATNIHTSGVIICHPIQINLIPLVHQSCTSYNLSKVISKKQNLSSS